MKTHKFLGVFFATVLFAMLVVLPGGTSVSHAGETALELHSLNNIITRQAAWIPPVGIPDPGFGINDQHPPRPTDWNAPVPGYYYVNAETGTDTNNTYGTPDHPRNSIPRPIPAGSYVEVHGVYDIAGAGATWIEGYGNAEPWVANVSGPAWVVGENGDRPAFTYKTIAYGEYLYLDSLDFRPSDGTSIGHLQISSGGAVRPADHVVVRNCDLRGDGISTATGIIVAGRSDGPAQNIVLYKNSIYNYGDMNTTNDQDAAPLIIASTSNVWALENTMHTCTAGLRVGGQGEDELADHIYVGRNTAYNLFQAGLAVKYANDVIFSENTVHDIVDTTWSPSKGIGFQYQPTRLWILHNTIYDCYNGIRGASDNGSAETPVYIIGNIIYNAVINGTSSYGQTMGRGIEINNGNSPRYIVSNTIYNTEEGITNGYYASTLHISNNIIQNASHAHIALYDSGTRARSTLNNTLFDNLAKIAWKSDDIQNLADFQATYGKGAGCVEGDALFVDPAHHDFRLQQNSSAIDQGIEDAVYQTFEDLYGLDIRVDASGTPRPRGSGWDIGAYEFVPALELHGTPTDQTIHLTWDINTTPAFTGTWTINYDGTPGIPTSPITDIEGSTRFYTITNLNNYELYIITLNAMLGETAWLSDTVQVMPTDRLVYLPLTLRDQP